MTADSVDLEECDNHFKGVVGSLFNEDNMDVVVNSFLNPPFRKLPAAPVFPNKYTTSMYDLNEMFMPPSYAFPLETSLDIFNLPKFGDWSEQLLPFETLISPEEDAQIRQSISDSINGYMMPTYENSSQSDVESDYQLIVSPDAVLPSTSLIKEENIGPLDSMWPELSNLSDEKLVKMVDDGYLENITIDDIFVKKKRRKLTHLDIDHCYSQRLPVDDDYEEEDEEDFFNSSPSSPASSSCSGKLHFIYVVEKFLIIFKFVVHYKHKCYKNISV